MRETAAAGKSTLGLAASASTRYSKSVTELIGSTAVRASYRKTHCVKLVPPDGSETGI
eukprot:SAG31_NODE_124_length_23684_cov_7.200127_10_plen_58_part_00